MSQRIYKHIPKVDYVLIISGMVAVCSTAWFFYLMVQP